jgi:phage gpG-like protein
VGLKVKTSANKLFKSIENSINRSAERALTKGALFQVKQLDLSYENRGFLRENPRGHGFEPVIPTTRRAKMARVTYPQGTPQPGKRFTQAQNRYLFGANSLEDTGALRGSLDIERENKKDTKKALIGAGVAYIRTSEEGGRFKGNTVPARPTQHATEQEVKELERIAEKEFQRGK